MRIGTDFRLDPNVGVDRMVVDRVLNDWYRAIAQLGGIPAPGFALAVSPQLRARYHAGVSDLLARAAATSGIPVTEWYRLNRGRIPPWAWHRPYHRVRGIATPVPERVVPEPGTGIVQFSVRGVAVTILPDGFDPAMRDKAETRSQWSWQAPGCQYTVGPAGGGAGVVTAVDLVPPPTVTIQTFYCQDVPPDCLAAYGRGSTKEDIAGAAVHPWSATVAFHEGQHGMDCFQFLKEEEVPRFGGRAGTTMALFRAACDQFNQAWTVYQARAGEFSEACTDDVGVPKRGITQAGPRPRVRVIPPGPRPAPVPSPLALRAQRSSHPVRPR